MDLGELYGTDGVSDTDPELYQNGDEYAGLGDIIRILVKKLGRTPTIEEVNGFLHERTKIPRTIESPSLAKARIPHNEEELPTFTEDDITEYVDPRLAEKQEAEIERMRLEAEDAENKKLADEAHAKKLEDARLKQKAEEAYADTAYLRPMPKKRFGVAQE